MRYTCGDRLDAPMTCGGVFFNTWTTHTNKEALRCHQAWRAGKWTIKSSVIFLARNLNSVQGFSTAMVDYQG